jgi:hypothetical protein
MNDSFGNEIQVGMVVEISDSCIKGDNGLWVVTSVYTSEAYCHKLNKDMRKAKDGPHTTVSWPLHTYLNDPYKRHEANRYNEEHARIRVLCPYVEPAPKPVSNDIKIQKRGIKKGNSFCSCYYWKGRDGSIYISARHYNEHIPRELGNVKNDSDAMTDYFETDSLVLTSESPYYQAALRCCK